MATKEYSWMIAPEMPAADQIVEVAECDIVVVGAGIGGNVGALKAADAGVNVHVLEKGNRPSYSREMTMAFNSQLQRDFGFVFDKESRDEMLSQYYGAKSPSVGCIGQIQENHWHTTRFVDTSGKMMDWLAPILIEEGIDVHVAASPEEYGSPMFLSYGRAGNPPDPWNEAVALAAQKRGAQYHFETSVYMLVQDENKRVTGVIARNSQGQFVRFDTRIGVLIAAGGIGNDAEMMSDLFWGNDRIFTKFNYETHTGDLHKAAAWIGAGLDELYWGDPFMCSIKEDAKITRVGSAVDWKGFDQTWPTAPGVGQLGVLWLDVAGRRCVDEGGDILAKPMRILNMPQGRIWAMWDGAWEAKFGDLIPHGDVAPVSQFNTWFAMNTQAQIDDDIARGVTFRCETLDEVAEITGMDRDTMMETIEFYNSDCAKGNDSIFQKRPEWMTPVDTPPYYVAGIACAQCITRGGIHTEEHMRAITTNGKVIPGLWVAGSGAGGLFGFGRQFGSTPVVQNSAWRAVYDMLGEVPPTVEFPTRAELGRSGGTPVAG